jgi:hypothetical protein
MVDRLCFTGCGSFASMFWFCQSFGLLVLTGLFKGGTAALHCLWLALHCFVALGNTEQLAFSVRRFSYCISYHGGFRCANCTYTLVDDMENIVATLICVCAYVRRVRTRCTVCCFCARCEIVCKVLRSTCAVLLRLHCVFQLSGWQDVICVETGCRQGYVSVGSWVSVNKFMASAIPLHK